MGKCRMIFSNYFCYRYFIQFRIPQITSLQMADRHENEVHTLTRKIKMRFVPAPISPPCQYKTQQIISKAQTMVSKLKQLLPIPLPKTQKQLPKLITSIKQLPQPQPITLQQQPEKQLKFALMLSPNHLLIGNRRQLDVIHISINSSNYVQAEYLESIVPGGEITHVCVEHKKISLLFVVADKMAYFYNFDGMKSPLQRLTPSKQMPLDKRPKFVEIVREGNVCLFFQDHLEVFLTTGNLRRRYNSLYELPDLPQSSFSLFYVPPNFENFINVFFEQKNNENPNVFTLWCMELQFSASEIKAHPIQKIYDIKQSLKKTIKLNNYSKQIFLLNLGSEILALKKGYVLDSATVNKKQQESLLQYVGNDVLLHISSKKIEVYRFSINLAIKTPKIFIKPRDSIKVNEIQEDQKYFRVLPALLNDYLIIFQEKSGKFKGNQLRYSFFITRGTTREEKMLSMFPKNVTTFKIQDPILQQKCDMAQKMGFTTKQIYLQLWNRSSKSTKDDYSTLVATQDYHTITQQIIRKLKKSSILVKQILETETASLSLLQTRFFSPQCNYEIAMNYINCHFFRRKMIMFKNIKNMKRLKEQQQSGGKAEKTEIKITIREYQFYKSMQVKNQLIAYINQLCNQKNAEKQELCNLIRFLLRSFRFALRTQYEQILQEIIKTANQNLVFLLKQIPEILPYRSNILYPSYIDKGFYDGVWSQIDKQQWEKDSLYVDKLTIIDNKQVVLEQVVKNINFKRYWLSQHDVVTLSTDQIKKNYQKIKSPHIFYFFIAKLFEHIKDEENLKSIVKYVQDFYSRKQTQKSQYSGSKRSSTKSRQKKIDNTPPMVTIPDNIKGKVFLMRNIYKFFEDENIVPLKNGQSCTLIDFFYFEDHELIRHCFQKQRSIKGILLKRIKSIYKQNIRNHAQLFNLALLHYFVSDVSTISDLKYLLNRINNEKQQFHRQNAALYTVLIQALQRKLKIGTGKDIPIDEVMIYLENIPLHYEDGQQSNTRELKSVEALNKNRRILQKSKINMSIYDILRNPQEVFNHLIEHAIQSCNYRVWETPENFISFALRKINKIEQFSKQIYEEIFEPGSCYKKTIFFIFLAKLCQDADHIKFAKLILNNQQFKDSFDSYTAQGLVQFMYKWKMCLQQSFLKNQFYILQLLKLIPQSSNTHIFIKNQLQFAKLLSYNSLNQVTFPISDTVLNFADVREIVNDLPIEFVMDIDIVKVYQIVHNIQNIVVGEIKTEVDADQMGMAIKGMDRNYMDQSMDPDSMITLAQIYEIFILKYLSENKLREVIAHINSLLSLSKTNDGQTYDIVFPILYIIHLAPELNQQNRQNLMLCVWYYFYKPKELMAILQHIVLTALTPFQLTRQIQESLKTGKEKYKGYNPKNIMLNQNYLTYVGQNRQNEIKFAQILIKMMRHIQESKEEFKAIRFAIIMAMLCNSPYVLVKFIQCSMGHNVKSIRSLLSYAILEDVFQPLILLEIGRRIFLILLEAYIMQLPIQVVIERFNKFLIDEDLQEEDYQLDVEEGTYEAVMKKSAQAFKNKKNSLFTNETRSRILIKNTQIRKKIQMLFNNYNDIQREPSNYIFDDSDNEQKMHIELEDRVKRKRSKRNIKFVPKKERIAIFESSRLNKPCALYKSIQGDYGLKNKGLFVSQRANSNVRSKNTFHNDSQILKSINRQISQEISQEYDHEFDQQFQNQFNAGKWTPTISHLKHPLMRVQSMSSQNIRESSDLNVGKSVPNRQHIQITKQFHDDSDIHQSFSPEVSKSQVSNNYEIHVHKQSHEDSISQQDLQILKQASNSLMDQMLKSPKYLQGQFNLTPIQYIRGDIHKINRLLRDLYVEHIGKASFHQAMKVMLEAVLQFRPEGINPNMFKLIVKIQEVQSKTIPEIPFSELIQLPALFKNYETQKQVFDELYQHLQKFVVSENIYTVSKFIRRVFDDYLLEQEVIWDFVLDLCQKIDQGSSEEKQWNLEKIKATLHSMDVVIWNTNFESFKVKVLEPDSRDQILQVFFQIMQQKKQKNKEECLKFIRNIQEVYESNRVNQIAAEMAVE